MQSIVDRQGRVPSGPADAGSRQSAAGSPPVKAGSLAGAWRRFAVRRLIGLAVNLLLLVLVTFFIVQLIPGDPAAAIAGEDASQTQVDQIRVELGLDQPMLVQLGAYIAQVAQGDFGTSFQYRIPATQIVATAAPYTISIAFISLVIFLTAGLALGMLVGIVTRGDRHRWLDHSFNLVAGIVSSIPAYVQATILVTVFAVWLAVLPPAYSPAYNVAQAAVLPIAALSIGCVASIARIVRRESAVILEQDYMRSARGWRLGARTLYAKHMLPNLVTTALTLSGIILTALLGSTLIVEAVFAWPGLGSVVVQAISEFKDYPVIRASVFVIGAISLLFNLLIDVVLGLIDPRTLGDDRG